MINPEYYKALLSEYIINESRSKIALLTSGLILRNYQGCNLHFNFPNFDKDYAKTVNMLYEFFAIHIIKNNANIPPIGSKWKPAVGKFSKYVFEVYKITDSDIFLICKNRGNLTLGPIPIKIFINNFWHTDKKIGLNNISSLGRYSEFIKSINQNGSLPTFFSKKYILIATKALWDNLDKKNCIPSIYLPNRKEENQTLIKSIPVLEDCIAYITPKYEVCYEEILKNNIKIEAILVCCNIEMIPQIIQDQIKYGFNLIVLTNEINPQKYNGLTLWDWKKEEIELIEKI